MKFKYDGKSRPTNKAYDEKLAPDLWIKSSG
jgi:hypothetical protein